MKSITTKSESSQPGADTAVYLFDDWFDPIEAVVRDRVRGFIQAMIEGELDETLQRPRYGRRPSRRRRVMKTKPKESLHPARRSSWQSRLRRGVRRGDRMMNGKKE